MRGLISVIAGSLLGLALVLLALGVDRSIVAAVAAMVSVAVLPLVLAESGGKPGSTCHRGRGTV